MPRLPFVLLASFALAAAQAQNLPSWRPGPISGSVLNSVTGDPVPGAIVHYMGVGNVTDQQNRVLNPNTLRGEVVSGPDGSYTTPPLPPLGEFRVRASAPGFFADAQSVQALPAGLPCTPPRPGYHGPPVAPCDGILRLRPDPLSLEPMSDAALASFALPVSDVANREVFSGVLSRNANTLTFRTLDSAGDGKTFTVRCRDWTYDLSSGTLTGSDLPGSPRTTGLDNSSIPPNFCPGSDSTNVETTTDGQFSVGLDRDGPSSCGRFVAISLPSHRGRTIADDECLGFSFILAGDRVFYSEDPNYVQSDTANITEFNMKTGARRVFNVPYHRDGAPQFIAEQPLPNGSLRMAYTVKGDCDPSSTDYNDMSPEYDLGPSPNLFSVCFITIPALAASQRPPGR